MVTVLTYTPSLYILYEVAPATAVHEKFIVDAVALLKVNPVGTAGNATHIPFAFAKF
ncbi:hypothetical protein D3C84_567160 [compost metagenome]